jgi:hypothetical protein
LYLFFGFFPWRWLSFSPYVLFLVRNRDFGSSKFCNCKIAS